MATTDDLLRELTEMKARLAAAEARIAELDGHREVPYQTEVAAPRRGDPDDAPVELAVADQADDPQPRATDRRGLLKGAGIAAGAAAAALGASVATASPAAAANGDPLTLGVTNNQATSPTKAYNASSFTHLFQFVDAPGVSASTSNGYASLTGAATGVPFGVAGYGGGASGAGVYGEATGTSGAGVRAAGLGADGVGVSATGTAIGVDVLMPPGAGTAVRTNGGVRGVQAANTYFPLSLYTNQSLAGPPTGTAAILGDVYSDSAGVLYYCTAAGTPGTWVRLTGPGTAGAFTAITPTRVYDSRLSGGRLSNGQTRVVSVANGINVSSGAVTTPNLVPAGASAIQFNLTVVDTTGSGYLQVAPGDAAAITSSSINWTATGQIIANGLMVKLDTSRQVKAFAMIGSTNFIVDVLGYYL